MGVQIYGASPENMAEAARRIVDKMQPEFLDINFGCPADKITCKNAGSSMLRDLPLMGRVIGTIVKALPHIGHDDRFIRYAARVALEKQPAAKAAPAQHAEYYLPYGASGRYLADKHTYERTQGNPPGQVKHRPAFDKLSATQRIGPGGHGDEILHHGAYRIDAHFQYELSRPNQENEGY